MLTKLLIAVTALSFAGIGAADAAKHHKRHRMAHYAAPTAAYVPAAPFAAYPSRPPWAAPQQCFTDEGYGRFRPCDAGPTTR